MGILIADDSAAAPPDPKGNPSPPSGRAAAGTFKLGHQPALDGLRAAVAIIGVIGYHEDTPWILRQGSIGVDVFFVISGFLITNLLLAEVRDSGRLNLRHFYGRRVRRLLPALGLLLAGVAIWAIVDQHGQRRVDAFGQIAAAAFYAADYVRAFQVSNLGPLGHTWSLAIEEQFYLLWPATLLALMAVGCRGRKLAVTLGVAAAMAVAWREFEWHRTGNDLLVYFSLDTRADGLLLGAAIAAAFHAGMIPTGRIWVWLRHAAALGGAVLLVVLAQYPGLWHHHSFTPIDILQHAPLYSSLAVLSAGLIIVDLVASTPHVGHAVLSWRPMVAIGTISYGLYLADWPIASQVTPQATGIHSLYPLMALHLVLIFTAATVSWFVVERRVLRRRRVPVTSSAGVSP